MGKRNNRGALPAFRERKRSNGKTYYYYDAGGKPRQETPLGTDYGIAIMKYAEFERDRAADNRVREVITFKYVADRYLVEVVPQKSAATQKDNLRELKNLLEFFNDPPAPLDSIQPQHVRQYLSWRKSAPVRANREKALLSAIWNFAREMGYTSLANPCSGVKGNRERGRDVYIEDSVYQAVYENASAGLQDSMDLAYLTGQRVTDVRLMNESDIRDNQLWVKQGKTSAKRRIELVGELALLIERIRARKETLSAYSPQLIVNEIGEAMTASMLRSRFDKARQDAGIPKSAFQLRDLRAKAGTDKAENSGDILQARDQLGHTTVTMTEAYIRDRKGKKVMPTK